MNFLYVKRGGAATGGSGVFGTPRSGSWATALPNAADYYDEIDDANADQSEGDVVCVSSLHSVNDHGNFVHNHKSGAIYTVDDANVDQVIPAPSPQWNQASSGASIIPLSGNEDALILQGLSFQTGGTHTIGQARGFLRTHDHSCASSDTNSSRYVRTVQSSSGARAIHHNIDINYPHASQGLRPAGSESQHLFLGGKIISGTTHCVYHESQEFNGVFAGTDFSENNAGTDLLTTPGTATAQTTYFYHWDGCPMPPGYSMADNFGSMSGAALIERGTSEYDWTYFCRAGRIIATNSAFYTTDELHDDGINRVSLRYLSELGIGTVRPTRNNILMPMMPYGPKWIERKNTSYATTPKARLKFLSANALDQACIDVYLQYRDGVTPWHWRTVRHHIAMIATPASLNTESGKWTGGAGTQFYLDLDMPSGGDGWVRAMVGFNFNGNDLDVYLSPQIDFVA